MLDGCSASEYQLVAANIKSNVTSSGVNSEDLILAVEIH
jgi:hypothetical protein